MYHDGEGATVEIDIGLVPLIEALWESGVDTQICCEGEWYIDEIDMGSTHHYAYVLITRFVLPKFALPTWLTVELSTGITVWRFPKSCIPEMVELVDEHGIREITP